MRVAGLEDSGKRGLNRRAGMIAKSVDLRFEIWTQGRKEFCEHDGNDNEKGCNRLIVYLVLLNMMVIEIILAVEIVMTLLRIMMVVISNLFS